MSEVAPATPPPGSDAATRARRLFEELSVGHDTSNAYDLRLVGRLWPYLKPHARLLALGLAFVPITTFGSLLQPYLVKRIFDAEVLGQGGEVRLRMLLAYATVVVVEFVCRFGEMYAMQLSGQRAMADLRRATFRHAQRMRTSYFDRTPVGRVLTRVTNDVDSLGELFASGAVMAVADVFLLVGIIAFMFALDARLTLVTLAVLPPLALAVEWIRRRAREAFRAIRVHVAQLNAYLSEQVQGMQVVQAFGREEASAEEYRIINDAYRRANYVSIRQDALLFSIVESVSITCVALVLWYAATRAGIAGNTAAYIGTVVAFYQYIQLFFVPVRDLSTKYTIIQQSLASAERVFAFLDTDEVERDAPARPGAAVADAPRALPEGVPAVRFRGVQFGYRPGEPVLRDLDLEVSRGKSLALVGATGAGKTSTIAMLLRLYDHDQGTIEVGGVDIRACSRRDLRRMFSVVPQDVFLFRGSVAENVALGHTIDEHRVEAVLRRVSAIDLIQRRPGGIHAVVEERGSNFSVGERQLIAFARALYRDAPILILDEATANIDSETEARIQHAVDELMQGRTSIVIAHRLSTIRKADHIVVLHKGRVTESGTHDELLRHGQVYAHLHQLQFGGDAASAAG